MACLCLTCRFSGMETHSRLIPLSSFPLVTLRRHTAFIGFPCLALQASPVLSCSVFSWLLEGIWPVPNAVTAPSFASRALSNSLIWLILQELPPLLFLTSSLTRGCASVPRSLFPWFFRTPDKHHRAQSEIPEWSLTPPCPPSHTQPPTKSC